MAPGFPASCRGPSWAVGRYCAPPPYPVEQTRLTRAVAFRLILGTAACMRPEQARIHQPSLPVAPSFVSHSDSPRSSLPVAAGGGPAPLGGDRGMGAAPGEPSPHARSGSQTQTGLRRLSPGSFRSESSRRWPPPGDGPARSRCRTPRNPDGANGSVVSGGPREMPNAAPRRGADGPHRHEPPCQNVIAIVSAACRPGAYTQRGPELA